MGSHSKSKKSKSRSKDRDYRKKDEKSRRKRSKLSHSTEDSEEWEERKVKDRQKSKKKKKDKKNKENEMIESKEELKEVELIKETVLDENTTNEVPTEEIKKALTEEQEQEKLRIRKEKFEAWKKAKIKENPSSQLSFSATDVEDVSALANCVIEAIKSNDNHHEVDQSKQSTIDESLNNKEETISTINNEEDQFVNEYELKNEINIDPRVKIMKDSEAYFNDSDSDENNKEHQDLSEEDPLDTFMVGIREEVITLREKDLLNLNKVHNTTKKKKKKITKGIHVMYNDEDALEYTSEEEDELLKALKEPPSTKKEIAKVDHLEQFLFRKNFYVPVPDLQRLTEEDIFQLRFSLGNIRVKGKNCPAPVKNWAQCGFSTRMMRIVQNYNYESPMPIQAQAIPAILSGRDIIGIAKTGSGKTLAFLLPLIRHTKDQPELEDGDGPISLVMAPTRELKKSVCVYGGTGISDQIAELKRGAHIIVCTPGRMIDMLCANNGRVTNLKRITFCVIDEADRMFDMGFEPQVMMILNNTRQDKQTVLFSATFPRAMEALARKVLNDPIEITVGGKSVVGKDITQHVIVIEDEDKFMKLLELLGHFLTDGLVLIFVDRHESADALLKNLIKSGYPCMTLHGGMDQDDRDSVIEDFKNKIVNILVATSVAARGLDVKELNLVVNYDVPNHYEDYVHRCGRTGRAGKKGTAVTLITPDQEKHSGDIIKALELSGTSVPEELKKLWDDFKEKKKNGLVKEHKNGYGGHGFKFNDEEKEKSKQEKELQKSIAGVVDSDDECQKEDDDLDKLIMSKMKKRKDSMYGLQIDKFTMSSTRFEDVVGRQEAETTAIHDSVTHMFGGQTKNTKIAEALARAQAINKTKNFGSAKSIYGSQSHSFYDNCHFEEELEINDFPQNARWRVTQREAIDRITEDTGAAVTVRGTYFPPNKEVSDGDKKLYLYIDADSEMKVRLAVSEITRIIKEELEKNRNQSVISKPQLARYAIC